MTDDENLLSDHVRANVLAATTAAVVGAARTGLLSALSTTPQTASELAATLELQPDPVERVLGLLETADLIRRDESGRWLAGPLLLAEAMGPSGGVPGSVHIWSRIDTYLRTGESLLESMPDERPRGPAYASAVNGLGRIFRRVSEQLPAALGPAPGSARILDVGTGSGQWTLDMIAQQPEAHLTGLDLPPVLPRLLGNARARGLEARVETIAGDYHAVELPAHAFDRVVAANVLHLETPEAAAAVVARLANALAPGGELVIIDALPDPDDEQDPRALAAYALSLGIRTGKGRPYSEGTFRTWLTDAGMVDLRRVDPPGPTVVAAVVGSAQKREAFL